MAKLNLREGNFMNFIVIKIICQVQEHEWKQIIVYVRSRYQHFGSHLIGNNQ